MMKMAPVMISSMLLIIACTAILVPTGVAQLEPEPIGKEIKECWSSCSSVEGCVAEIFMSFFSGEVGVGPACCKAITELNEKCWPKMFPFNPFFPPLLLGYCASI